MAHLYKSQLSGGKRQEAKYVLPSPLLPHPPLLFHPSAFLAKMHTIIAISAIEF